MKILLTIFLSLVFTSVYADDTPVIYSKTVIKIIPSRPRVSAEATEQAEKNDNKKSASNVIKDAGNTKSSDLFPDLKRVSKEFTVEVRPLSFLEQKDFISHQPFTDKEGMMMLIEPAQVAQLKSANLIGKIDVLFVSPDGIVEKIAPDLVLPDLLEPIDSEKPVRAFIFLKAGQAKDSDIEPGDYIENQLFKSHPVILQ